MYQNTPEREGGFTKQPRPQADGARDESERPMTNKTNILASVTAIAIGAGILIAPVAQAQTGPSDAMRAPVDVMVAAQLRGA